MFRWVAHKQLWNWLADNPEMDKGDWPGWKQNGGEFFSPYSYCFACDDSNIEDGCGECPLDTDTDPDNDFDSTFCLGGLYWKWRTAWTNGNLRKVYALEIANLPLKEGVEWE